MGGRGSSSHSHVKNKSVSKKMLSAEQMQAIDSYIDDSNGEVGLVRAVQQGKNIGSEQEKYKNMGELIESVISGNKQKYGIIYRGIAVPKKDLSKYVEGYVFDQKGTSSWSGSDGKALEYAFRKDLGGSPVMFISKNGKNAAHIGKISSLNEDEWLHSKKQKFRTTWSNDVYIRGYGQNVRIVEVEEV